VPDTPPLWQARERDADIDVLGIGENSLDHVYGFEGPVLLGDKHALSNHAERPGGQIASAMLGCARLGLRTAYVGAIGSDAAARTVLAPLERAGVDLSGMVEVAGAATRTATILVRPSDGLRTVLAHRDPGLALEPAQLDAGRIRSARALHLDACDPDLSEWAAGVARAAGIPVVLDVDHVWPNCERLLRLTDFPVVARQFADEIGEIDSPAECLDRLVGWGARLAVVTLGERGAVARSEQLTMSSSAFPVQARDTTGSGDAFHAGFIWGLLQGFGAERVLHVANAVAALTCEAPGAQEGLPTRDELEVFLAERSDTGRRTGARRVCREDDG
jgi:sugar/nucleoside kinase (ribokinase family)